MVMTAWPWPGDGYELNIWWNRTDVLSGVCVVCRMSREGRGSLRAQIAFVTVTDAVEMTQIKAYR